MYGPNTQDAYNVMKYVATWNNLSIPNFGQPYNQEHDIIPVNNLTSNMDLFLNQLFYQQVGDGYGAGGG